MSDVTPNPENADNGALPFDLSNVNVTEIPPLPNHEPPNPDAGKRPWWKPKPKANGTPRVKMPKASPSMPRGGLRAPLENMYTGLGMAVCAIDQHCGMAIINNATECAKAMDELAKTNPAVRRILMKLVETSALGTVIMAHAPIVMAIAMHHVPALKDSQEGLVSSLAEQMTKDAAEGKNKE